MGVRHFANEFTRLLTTFLKGLLDKMGGAPQGYSMKKLGGLSSSQLSSGAGSPSKEKNSSVVQFHSLIRYPFVIAITYHNLKTLSSYLDNKLIKLGAPSIPPTE
jgi:hypothetical protein